MASEVGTEARVLICNLFCLPLLYFCMASKYGVPYHKTLCYKKRNSRFYRLEAMSRVLIGGRIWYQVL